MGGTNSLANKYGQVMKGKNLLSKINKAIWTVFACVLIVFLLVFYVFEKGQRQAHLNQVEVLLGAVYQANREDLANEIFSDHREALSLTLQSMRKIEGVAGVRIFLLDRQLFASAGSLPREDLSIDDKIENNRPIFREYHYDDKQYITLSTIIEVVGERVGYCQIWYDLTASSAVAQQRMWLVSGIFFLTLLSLSIILSLLLTRWVTKPVLVLHDAMGRVMKGHLGEQVTLQQDDEIGRMATAFNTMSEKLKEQNQKLFTSIEIQNSYARQLEQTNQELAHLNTELESIVEERTRELRNSYEKLEKEIAERQKADNEKRALEKRLARSEKMEALGLLAGGVAHDLNNVLSGIVSYPDLLLMQLERDSPLIPMILTMQRSGQKAAAIVQDMLILTRRGVPNNEVVNINSEVIADYLESPEFKKLQLFHQDVIIETRLAPDLTNIRGSIIHLKKMVMNLVSNAAEAQPDGGRIIISTKNCSVDRPFNSYSHVNEGAYVLLTVEDFGIGIAAGDLDHIFEPFYTKKVMDRSGTGLGMAIVWGTVEDHNGYINVTSIPKQGTRFDLYFPVTLDNRIEKDKSVSINEYMGNQETILVIDDIAEQRQLALALLTALNYKVTAVSNGEEAVDYLQRHTVDILLLDMIMNPGMDGLATYAKIIEIHPKQKAVIASGFAENQRVKDAQRLGAGEYVRKPYTLEKIAAAIYKELARDS
jgi:signal transduction histidine kinase/CheY-like chemotaxis protein